MNNPDESGYIVDLFDGSAWLKLDGSVTDKWEERGVWATEEQAQEAMRNALMKDKP